MKRFVSIWFPYLSTDWFSICQPHLRAIPFVLAVPDHGRKLISAANEKAVALSIEVSMVVADAKAIYPTLTVIDDKSDLRKKILKRIAEWCIRFSPCVAVDGEDGLLIDATGCTHLWGGDVNYLCDIYERFKKFGYTIKLSIANTVGAAWAMARFSNKCIVEPGGQSNAILYLPSAALRLEYDTIERLKKLGLRQVKDFIGMPTSTLRRRFGDLIIKRINQALGNEEEIIEPVCPPVPYQERMPCLEPIATATGIEIALEHLLDALCKRLKQEGKGIRKAVLKCYRVDGKIELIEIGTIRASHHVEHLFKLFELKIASIEPALGIELFTLEATKVEDHVSLQSSLWKSSSGLKDERISELLDRLSNKIGISSIRRYLPAEHYWPERSVRTALSLDEEPATIWKVDRPRPLQLLSRPEPIQVTAPIPDYPPMNFRYRGKLHTVSKADGPERIEQEWWIEQGQHRDYYYVEDEEGYRYWLFRLGHYHEASYKWFIHGVFV